MQFRMSPTPIPFASSVAAEPRDQMSAFWS